MTLWINEVAFSADDASLKQTNPKPLEVPVSSLMMAVF
jgi:hypothetical protein